MCRSRQSSSIHYEEGVRQKREDVKISDYRVWAENWKAEE